MGFEVPQDRIQPTLLNFIVVIAKISIKALFYWALGLIGYNNKKATLFWSIAFLPLTKQSINT